MDGAWDVCRSRARRRACRIVRSATRPARGDHAGLTRARALDVVMDCDSRSAEEIASVREGQEGYEIVRAVRLGSAHALPPRRGSRLPLPLPGDVADDGVRDAEHHLAQGRGCVPQPRARPRVPADADWLGFTQATVTFEHGTREDGASAYTCAPADVAFDGMYFARRAPAAHRDLGLRSRWRAAFRGVRDLRGSRGLARLYEHRVCCCFSAASSSSALGVGLYVGRIFDQVKGRAFVSRRTT